MNVAVEVFHVAPSVFWSGRSVARLALFLRMAKVVFTKSITRVGLAEARDSWLSCNSPKCRYLSFIGDCLNPPTSEVGGSGQLSSSIGCVCAALCLLRKTKLPWCLLACF